MKNAHWGNLKGNIFNVLLLIMIFLVDSISDGKELAYNAADLGLIPGSGRFPGKGNGNPLQYSCLENPMDRGAWWSAAHGIAESNMTQ